MTVGEDKPVSGTDIEGSIYQSKCSRKCPFISWQMLIVQYLFFWHVIHFIWALWWCICFVF